MEKKKSEITIEALVKIALVLFVTIVVFVLVFVVLRPSLGNIKDERDNQDPDAKNVFDLISNIFGGCKDGDKRCMGDFIQTCEEGDWITGERCLKGCNKEGNDCQ